MIVIKKQNLISRVGDIIMLPLMYLLQATIREIPQRTHRWNNQKFPVHELAHLESQHFVSVAADTKATPRWLFGLPIFHMPIVGGWKQFVVIAPVVPITKWYIGWIPGDTVGLSQIQLTSAVRVLRGPSHVYFFGLDEHGAQIQIEQQGSGVVRNAGIHKNLPLL